MGEGFMSFLVLFFGFSFIWFGMDGYVIHVNGEPSLCHLHSEDMVHHHLKGGRRVCQTKEHDQWFK